MLDILLITVVLGVYIVVFLISSTCTFEMQLVINYTFFYYRVVAFLSPSYLEDDDRVDEYNAAWCLNRKNDSQTRLAPMLCRSISGLPTYMSLIQWVDIR